MQCVMSGFLLNLYFMSASANMVLRDPGITHLPLHRHPQISLHGLSHGHSGHKTGISNSYTSFMVFPSVSLFYSLLSLSLSLSFFLWSSCFFALCRVNHSKMSTLQPIVVHPHCFAFCLFSNFCSAVCFCSSLSVSVVKPYPRNLILGTPPLTLTKNYVDFCRYQQESLNVCLSREISLKMTKLDHTQSVGSLTLTDACKSNYGVASSYQINTLKTHTHSVTHCLCGRIGSIGAVFQVRHGAYLTTVYMIQIDFQS